MSFKDNFTILPRGFLVNTNEPIDARFSVPNSESRLNIATVANPEGEGFVATQLYNGLIMFQKDTEELFLLLDKDNAGLESSWKLLYPTSGSSDTGSLITASADLNVLAFTKSNGDTFTVTIDTGSSDTDSLITASIDLNVLAFTKSNGDTFTLTIDTGSGGDAFPFTGSAEITGSLIITGSLDTTGSVKLALDTSSTAVDNVMVYNSQSGQVFFTSSDAIGGSSVKFLGDSEPPITPPQTIQTITTKDFEDDETKIQFDINTGDLKFLFGQIPVPSCTIFEENFEENKFNLEEQTFNVKGKYFKEADGFISASLIRLIPTPKLTLDDTPIDTPSAELFKQLLNSTGSKTDLANLPEYRFRMELTSSNVLNGNDRFSSAILNLNLDKEKPDDPFIEVNHDISTFGGKGNIYNNTIIEVGATGSLSYTSSVLLNRQGATFNKQNWRFYELENDTVSLNITAVNLFPTGKGFQQKSGSINISNFPVNQSFKFASLANFDSDNGNGATSFAKGDPLNDPTETATTFSAQKPFTRVKSIRAAAFLPSHTGSILIDPADIDFWTKNGIIEHTFNNVTITGKYFWHTPFPNPINKTVVIANPSTNPALHHVLIHEDTSAYDNVEIFAGTQNAQSSFFINNVNGYRIYISKLSQGGIPNNGVPDNGQTYTFKIP